MPSGCRCSTPVWCFWRCAPDAAEGERIGATKQSFNDFGSIYCKFNESRGLWRGYATGGARFGRFGGMPLKLSLKPGETFVVNGAVVQNGERRGVLLLQNRARILRERDLMRVEDVAGAASRTYFALMLFYLSGDNAGPAYQRFMDALSSLQESLSGTTLELAVTDISACVTAGDFYRALGLCRKLVEQVETSSAAGEHKGQ